MHDLADTELLRQYAHGDSHEAFAALLARHLNLVYSAALRKTGSPEAAEDITQVVFSILAKKARALPAQTILAGWLHHTSRLTAVNFLRTEIRRVRLEQEAHMQSLATETEPELWPQIMPLLDDAMGQLGEKDRDAIVLRFFEGKSFAEVARATGASENAAKKRVQHALEKLRRYFAKRGVVSGTSALAAAIAAHSVQAAPASLLAQLAAAHAGAAVSAGTAALVAATLRQMLWLKLRPVIGWGAAAVATLVLLKLLAPGLAPAKAPPIAATQPDSPSPAPLAETAPARAAPATPPATATPAGNLLFLHIRAAADNQPVPNATVILDLWRHLGLLQESTLRSDTNGLCELPVSTAGFDTYRVWVSADSFVPKVMDWKPYELQDPATSYTIRLDRGLTLAGVVQDEQGAPVPGANIRFTGPGTKLDQRENVALSSSASEIRSDAAGRFVSRQMPASADAGIGVVVSHPDYAAQWLLAALPESLGTNWVVVLTPGLPLSGRVGSAQGGPVSGATILAHEPHGGVDISARSDDQGQFTLVHLPAGVAELQVRATGFAELKRNVLVESNVPPVLLELQPPPTNVMAGPGRHPVRLSGTVVDATSGAAVPRFEVLLIKVQQLTPSRSSQHPPQRLAEGREGAFDWTDPLTYGWAYMLEVDAEGYEPQQSTLRQHDDGDQSFEFRLQKGGLLAGRVLQPDGRPAAGATLGLANDRYGLELKLPASLDSHGGRWSEAKSDNQGAFALKTMIGAVAMMVVHESGCALLPPLPNTNLVVQLEAWGAIEGAVYIGSSPAAGQAVDVGYQSTAYAWDKPRILFQFTAKSDNAGRFRFEKVPPGNHMVFRYLNPHEGKPGPVGFSHGQPVTVRPGETAQVTVGGTGRAVIGRFVMSPALTNYDWSSNWVPLVQDRPELVPPQVTQFSNFNAFARADRVYDASIAKYYLKFQPDGAFRAEDVLPGQYTLTLSITAPPADPLADDAWAHPGPMLGATTKTVVVPPMSSERLDEPLDLGPILVPIVDTPAPGNAGGKR